MMKRILILVVLLSLSSFSLAAPEEDWKELKAQHFIIYYKEAPEAFVETVEKVAESFFDEIMSRLKFRQHGKWQWDNRVKIFIYNTAEEYILGSQQFGWSGGAASIRQKIIRTYPTDSGFFDTTLPHELGHIIFHEFVGFKADVPLWFSEGVAMYQERAQRWQSDKIVKKSIETGTFIPLKELHSMRLTRGMDRSLIELFYAESASVVRYILNQMGDFRFSIFCRELKEGKSFQSTLRKTYPRFKDFDKVNKLWVQSLKK